MLPSDIKKMIAVSGGTASLQQQQLVSHWKDMSSSLSNGKKRRRAPETHQSCRVKSKTEDVSHATTGNYCGHEKQQKPAKAHGTTAS